MIKTVEWRACLSGRAAGAASRPDSAARSASARRARGGAVTAKRGREASSERRALCLSCSRAMSTMMSPYFEAEFDQ
jgi:hypothetical protein